MVSRLGKNLAIGFKGLRTTPLLSITNPRACPNGCRLDFASAAIERRNVAITMPILGPGGASEHRSVRSLVDQCCDGPIPPGRVQSRSKKNRFSAFSSADLDDSAALHETMIMDKDYITIFESQRKFTISVSILLIIFIIMSGVIASNIISNNKTEYGYIFWSFYIGIAAIILLRVTFALRDVPRLTLSSEGIRLTVLWRSRLWPWSEVGPFSVDVQTSRWGWMRYRFLVAFSDRHYDLLTAHRDKQLPTTSTADVSIPIFSFDVGRSEERAQAFADEVNRWRERYGAPEITVDPSNPRQQYEALTKRLHRRFVSYLVLMLVVIIVAVALFGGRHGRGGLIHYWLN